MENSASAASDEALRIISEYLDVPVAELQPEKSLEELGADSLDFVEIVFELEEKLGIKSEEPLPELRKKIHSIGDVLRMTAELVEAKRA